MTNYEDIQHFLRHELLEQRKEEIAIAKRQAEADYARAQELKRQNDVLEQQAQEDRRRNDLIDEALAWVRNLRRNHHDPIMRGLKNLDDRTNALINILQIAIPVLVKDGKVDHVMDRIYEALRSASPVNVTVTGSTSVASGQDTRDMNMAGGNINDRTEYNR